ncbi:MULTISPECIES: hypothetical protein [Rhizobium]|uniref:hypothetical protein n=1 Tax=Rhizobium TaxID=379 RepID=UPI000462E25D|nr:MULTISPECIES: hypothetical protein [Rhizobium]MCA0801666.1 hypothetical protein [Rhizobium sp. T1473]MCS0459483.1 hypothetical protein [Rhizobium favelukesii]UFS80947.1 hypothetical protein LPB79_21710 [Rhizobium sp. T136]
MADKDGGIISTVAQVVEKFVGDYSIWLWLMVFGACLLFMDSRGYVSIAQLQTHRQSQAMIGFVFATCMFLNALRPAAPSSNSFRRLPD